MKKIREIATGIYPIITNKYIAVLLVFFFWMLFFDDNNVVSQVKTQIKLSELRADKAHYEKEIAESRSGLSLLQKDRALLEKFAREKYLMKKENEDIFVFVVEED